MALGGMLTVWARRDVLEMSAGHTWRVTCGTLAVPGHRQVGSGPWTAPWSQDKVIWAGGSWVCGSPRAGRGLLPRANVTAGRCPAGTSPSTYRAEAGGVFLHSGGMSVSCS